MTFPGRIHLIGIPRVVRKSFLDAAKGRGFLLDTAGPIPAKGPLRGGTHPLSQARED
jgi:hypothetical protein